MNASGMGLVVRVVKAPLGYQAVQVRSSRIPPRSDRGNESVRSPVRKVQAFLFALCQRRFAIVRDRVAQISGEGRKVGGRHPKRDMSRNILEHLYPRQYVD